MAAAALSKTQRKNAKKRAKASAVTVWAAAEPRETGVDAELLQLLRIEYLRRFEQREWGDREDDISLLAGLNHVASYAALDRFSDNCFTKLRKIPQLSLQVPHMTDAIHTVLERYKDEHDDSTPPAVVASATAHELLHPSPPVPETAPSGVTKSKEVTQGTAPKPQMKGTLSLRQQVHNETSQKNRQKEIWGSSYDKAVQQLSQDHNLKVPLEEYQQTMCEFGRAMLRKELTRKTVAIIKYTETMKKYKQMKK